MKEEPVNVLDEQGNETGQVMLKTKAHAQGLWHPVIHLWIYNSKGQILMQMRAPQKQVWPNLWDVSAGGHVTAGESKKEAAIKEAGEEIGLKLDAEQLQFLGQAHSEREMEAGWMNRIYIWSYLTKLDLDISKLKLEKEEVTSVKWFELDELDDLLSDAQESKHFAPDIMDDSKMAIAEIRKSIKANR